jgi:hypothetical protein
MRYKGNSYSPTLDLSSEVKASRASVYNLYIPPLAVFSLSRTNTEHSYVLGMGEHHIEF